MMSDVKKHSCDQYGGMTTLLNQRNAVRYSSLLNKCIRLANFTDLTIICIS